MKLMKCYLLCLVALLLLFSAYCQPLLVITPSLTQFKPNGYLNLRQNTDTGTKRPSLRVSLHSSCGFAVRYHLDKSPGMLTHLCDSLRPLSDQTSYYQFSRPATAFPFYHIAATAFPFYHLSNTALIITKPVAKYESSDFSTLAISRSDKERSGFGRGAAIGAAIGFPVGAIVGLAVDGSPAWDLVSPGESMLIGALFGALVGAIVGGFIGRNAKRRKQRHLYDKSTR